MAAAREVTGWALGTHRHHIDHLVPLCAYMPAVLQVPSESDADIVRTCYPGVVVSADQEWYVSRAFEGRVVYYSHLLPRDELRRLFSGRPPARVVFCPHGFSEKRQRWSARAASQDVFLVHGQYGLDQLREWGVLTSAARYVITGNLRYQYYLAHRRTFDAIAARLTPKRDPARRTLIYAPTWSDQIGSSSAGAILETLISGLPQEYDLLIKMHPLLETEGERLQRVLAAAEAHPRVTVLRDNPMSFPFLALADIYIGDMSALAYDFLVFDRPLFFLNQTAGGPADAVGSRLFQCGVVVEPTSYRDIYRTIASTLRGDSQYSARRLRLWAHVHDQTRTVSDVTRDIATATRGAAPEWMDEASSREDLGVGADTQAAQSCPDRNE